MSKLYRLVVVVIKMLCSKAKPTEQPAQPEQLLGVKREEIRRPDWWYDVSPEFIDRCRRGDFGACEGEEFERALAEELEHMRPELEARSDEQSRLQDQAEESERRKREEEEAAEADLREINFLGSERAPDNRWRYDNMGDNPIP